MALESGKLNHLVEDVRQRGRGSHRREAPQPTKIISVNSVKDKKQKVQEVTKAWMNASITFPAISLEDVSEEPLIVEAEVKGYLVRRVYVDEGSSVEVMFEHYFENHNPRIKSKLKETQTDLVGFSGKISKPFSKIESGLKTLRAIPSTIHFMMKFPTMKGVATLVTWTVIITECMRLERKQMIEGESSKEVEITEEVLVNLSFLDQRVTIGDRLTKACRDQLKCLLKGNMGVFVWESSDMTSVPRKIIEHALNVNLSLDLVCQKRITFSPEKSGVTTNEVSEWIKAGIVHPIRYPTYISNPILVKKGDGT
ncbi:hypothetical protein Tco_1226718 [Tanacetum coccineum]